MACTQPSLPAPERFCSPEELGEESRWAEKQLVSPSSRQMLGTIRINGLEIQVRAIQKLPDYSKYRSLRRKRLIEAQNWKRSNPGVAGERQERDSCAEEALVCLPKRNWASTTSYWHGLLSGPGPWPASLPTPANKLAF